ncbi:MAG TPA: glucose 1-dehydrogenase [Nevskia sp.]|nr:glucose 1-dehydrogenase [Nevskia sp.]
MQGTLFDLSGKTALVTGSTRGIGRACAEQLARHGARVAISSRSAAECAVTAASINAEHGAGRAIAQAANLSRKHEVLALADAALAAFGRIDILVCNAAIHPWTGPTLDIVDETFARFMQANVQSSIWLAQKVLPGMIGHGDGRIILISSLSGLTGSARYGLYAISKAADLQLARNLAVEYGRRGIRANAVAPDVHRTEMARSLWGDPQLAEGYLRRNPSGRFGEPEEIAGTVVWLASRAGGNVNGQTIVVDGGYSLNYDWTPPEVLGDAR